MAYPRNPNRLPTVKLTEGEWTTLIMRVLNHIDREAAEAAVERALGKERARALIDDKVDPRLTKPDNHRLVQEFYPLIPGKTEAEKEAWLLELAADAFPDTERLREIVDYVRDRIGEFQDAGGTLEEYPEPAEKWRTDIHTIEAADGRVEFWTRNVEQPPENNSVGAEWIIAHLGGDGFQRLLIMTMADRPSRILLEISSGKAVPNVNGSFPVPLPGPSHWVVESDGTQLSISLDGREVYRQSGPYLVRTCRMKGEPRREFIGEWRE